MPKHFLVVAADQHLQAVLAQILTTEGCSVRTVGTAHDALQVALFDPFDAILVAPELVAAYRDLEQHLRTLGISAIVIPVPEALAKRAAAAVMPVANAQHAEQPLRSRMGQLSLRPRSESPGGRADERRAARHPTQASAVSRTNLPAVAASPGPAQTGAAVRAASPTGSAPDSTAPSAPGQAERSPLTAPPQIGQRVDARV